MNTLTLLLAVIQPLWPNLTQMPDFDPQQIAAMTDECGQYPSNPKPGFDADQHRMPYIDWYEAPAKPNGACMILISGGGYWNCCDVELVADWHRKFTALGYQCVKLVYRTPRPQKVAVYQTAWDDGQRAVRLVRSQAMKYGFDPEKIGVIGMSAGSHLSTLLATSSQTPAYAKVDALDDVPCHINWAITGPLAYGVTDGLYGPNQMMGDFPGVQTDPAFKFDDKTCPMCMLHGGMDIYSATATTHVYRQLRRKGVPAEIHLFADRPHPFWGQEGRGNAATGYDNWFGRVEEFLNQMQFVRPLGPEIPLMERYSSDEARGEYVKEDVWLEGRMPNAQPHQCKPYLEWHFPKVRKTAAIQIVYSGGSYTDNKPDGFEVAPFRRFLNEKGVTVVTLKYRTPRPEGLAKHVTAWQDLQRTIRHVRAKAPDYGLDPNRIGIMGSSAGGHLTLMGATSSRHRAYYPLDANDPVEKLPCNVQWAVAIYPAYSLTDGLEHTNKSHGNDDSAVLAPEFTFDPDTCPMIFIHGDVDVWSAMNSVKAWEKLRLMGVQCDLHTLVTRNHCFQRAAAEGTGSYTWMNRIWEFFNHKGFLN